MWLLPLYLHLNKKSDDDDDDYSLHYFIVPVKVGIKKIFFLLLQEIYVVVLIRSASIWHFYQVLQYMFL